jgi:PPK2 family polyphosphate:nucleotide phosphotransferase
LTRSLSELLRVPEGGIDVRSIDTRSTPAADGGGKRRAAQLQAELADRLADLQEKLYAEGRTGGKRSLLLVLQGLDTSGKSGTIKHVIGQIDPQGAQISAFKAPTPEERRHDFLWRIKKRTPAPGMIGVFDRSHYEDVLVVRVKNLIEEERWRSRYDSINDFERMLARERTVIVKFFLHISKEAQLDRFRERLERPDKHYKFSANDVRERRNWDAYQEAYADAVRLTATPWAPWYVVPSDHKWYRNLVVARIVCATLQAMNPQWPSTDEALESYALDELEESTASNR